MLPMDFCDTYPPRERRDRALRPAGAGRDGRPGRQAARDALRAASSSASAIARALANDPPLLVADEPTGNLDSQTADEVLAAVLASSAAAGKTVVMVTHERDVASSSTARSCWPTAASRATPAGGRRQSRPRNRRRSEDKDALDETLPRHPYRKRPLLDHARGGRLRAVRRRRDVSAYGIVTREVRVNLLRHQPGLGHYRRR